MRRDKKVLLAAMLGAAVMAAPAVSMAQAQSPWYAGATIGQSKAKDFCGGVSPCDDKDTAFRILGGYQINRIFAAELGYHDLGKTKVGTSDIKANAWELVGVGAYPIANQFSVYGKLGLFRGEAKGAAGVKETNTDLTYGLGLQFDVNRNVGVRGEWQRYPKMGGGGFNRESDVDVISLGAIWRFQ
jgi:OOP family OmpA-OmpF porin